MSDKTEPSDDEREAIYQTAYGHDHDAMRHSSRDVFWAGYAAGVATHNTPFRCLNDEACGDHDGVWIHSVRCGVAEAKYHAALLVPTSKETSDAD